MKKILAFLITAFLLIGVASADWRYNPHTGKLDYYEAALPTPGAAGDIVYYDGANWAILTAGANGLVLTLNTGLPTWMAAGGGDVLVGVDAAAVAGYLGAASNDGVLRTNASIAYADGGNFVTLSVSEAAVDHDSLLNYVAGQHLVLPGTIVATLTDHDATTHTDVTIANDLTIASTSAMSTTGSMTVGSLIGPAAALDINTALVQDVNFWDTIASGNPSINIYGWNTAGGDRESAELTMDDTNDEFLIQVPNSVNNEGVTVSLLETNQMFRIRQNSDVISMYHDGTDAQFHTTDGTFIFDSDEAAAEAAIVLYDDDTNFVTIVTQEMAANWTLTLPADGGADGEALTIQADGTTDWEAPGGGLANINDITLGIEVKDVGEAEALIELDDNTDQHFIESSSAEGLTNNEMRISLDDDNQALILTNVTNRNTDFGFGLATIPGFIVHDGTNRSRLQSSLLEIKSSAYGLSEQSSKLKLSASVDFWFHGSGGDVKMYPYHNDTLADNGTVNLADATSGFVLVSCNAESGMWLIQNDGSCTKIAGSTNTANTESDGNLCVYDGGGTQAIVKNMLGAAGEIRIVYWYN